MKQAARVIFEIVVKFFERSAHQRVARELLTLTDKQLDDIGFSRQKLYKGAAGYPWRLDTITEGAAATDIVATTEVTEAADLVDTEATTPVMPAKADRKAPVVADDIAKVA